LHLCVVLYYRYMDKAKTTPKDFFLWAGALLSLYISVSAFLALIFDYINYTFPDILTSSYITDPYQGGISYEMASIIVLFPLFIVLMRIIHKSIEREPSRGEVWVRRWALVLTLFLAGFMIAGDLIVLLTTFLNGDDITTRFLLKVLVVLLVGAVAFMHFIADLWGYWEQYPARARSVGYAAALLAVLTIIAGFFIIGTPQHARLVNLDNQKVSDLQEIQSDIVSYYQEKQMLPATLSDVNDPLSYTNIPNDPQSNEPYQYQATGTYSFNLCADFNATGNTPSYNAPIGTTVDNWAHGAGQVCFSRTIDPQRYPSINNAPIKAIQ
jgi:Domain of unknown function (DUF5671)